MGGRAKGLSFEEKRKRMSQYFMEKRDYFQLRELEKHLPKEKGIVSQSVKEVLQSLVDDRLVSSEKIGTSNYFWSFPSTALQSRKVKIEGLKNELEKLVNQQTEIQQQIVDASAGRQDGKEREANILKMNGLELQNNALQSELEQFKEMDPDLFEQKKIQMEQAKVGADRWTDNIFTLQSHCVNTFGIARSDFFPQFGVPEDFDHLQ